MYLTTLFATAQSINDLIPNTRGEIRYQQDRLITHIQRQSTLLQAQFAQDASFKEIQQSWDYLHATIVRRLTTLMQVPRVYQDLSDSVHLAAHAINQAYIKYVCNNQLLIREFEGYSERHINDSMTPFEAYYLQRIAHGYQQFASNPHALKHLSSHLKQKHSQPFQTHISHTIPKQHDNQPLSIFTANIIFMPENFSYYFGGIRPWPQRVKALCHQLLSLDADVLALQEVFDEQGAQALIDQLKEHYAYFLLRYGASLLQL